MNCKLNWYPKLYYYEILLVGLKPMCTFIEFEEPALLNDRFFCFQARKLIQKIDLGPEGVMPLEIRYILIDCQANVKLSWKF